jgi:hypothetical protein
MLLFHRLVYCIVSFVVVFVKHTVTFYVCVFDFFSSNFWSFCLFDGAREQDDVR